MLEKVVLKCYEGGELKMELPFSCKDYNRNDVIDFMISIQEVHRDMTFKVERVKVIRNGK